MKFLLNLFIQKTQPKTFKEIIYWWGERRLAYNIFVGVSGIISILLCCLFGFALDWLFVGFVAISYCIFANILYTSGWIAEGLLRKANNFDEHISFVGPVMFAAGLIVSVLLTFFSGIIAGYMGLFQFRG